MFYGANTYSVRRLLWILASSLALGAFWEISMLFFRLMIAKVGLLLIRFLVMNYLIGLIIIILLVCLSLVLVILRVMGGKDIVILV